EGVVHDRQSLRRAGAFRFHEDSSRRNLVACGARRGSAMEPDEIWTLLLRAQVPEEAKHCVDVDHREGAEKMLRHERGLGYTQEVTQECLLGSVQLIKSGVEYPVVARLEKT